MVKRLMIIWLHHIIIKNLINYSGNVRSALDYKIAHTQLHARTHTHRCRKSFSQVLQMVSREQPDKRTAQQSTLIDSRRSKPPKAQQNTHKDTHKDTHTLSHTYLHAYMENFGRYDVCIALKNSHNHGFQWSFIDSVQLLVAVSLICENWMKRICSRCH